MTLELDDLLMRLASAAAVGIAIGLNRDLRDKPMGMRTLGLVAIGAATVTVSALQVDGLYAQPDALSRVVQGLIQGIMGGVSFIGAGVILRDHGRRSVHGLTTAATVWVTAGLGIACGLGAWRTIGVSVALTLLLLIGLGWLEQKLQGEDD